jgi:hypothetical protein
MCLTTLLKSGVTAMIVEEAERVYTKIYNADDYSADLYQYRRDVRIYNLAEIVDHKRLGIRRGSAPRYQPILGYRQRAREPDRFHGDSIEERADVQPSEHGPRPCQKGAKDRPGDPREVKREHRRRNDAIKVRHAVKVIFSGANWLRRASNQSL